MQVHRPESHRKHFQSLMLYLKCRMFYRVMSDSSASLLLQWCSTAAAVFNAFLMEAYFSHGIKIQVILNFLSHNFEFTSYNSDFFFRIKRHSILRSKILLQVYSWQIWETCKCKKKVRNMRYEVTIAFFFFSLFPPRNKNLIKIKKGTFLIFFLTIFFSHIWLFVMFWFFHLTYMTILK